MKILISIVPYVCVLPAKSFQLCPTLCDPMDCSPPGSSVHRISQARILEWVAISSSRGASRPRALSQSLVSHALSGGFFLPLGSPGKTLWSCGGGGLVAKSCLTLATLWTVAHQAPLSMGFFSRQEYWSGLLFLSPWSCNSKVILGGQVKFMGRAITGLMD